MKKISFAIFFASSLISCSTPSIPPQEQLAAACNTVATGYNEAIIAKTAGKLTAAQIAVLTNLAPTAEKLCDPTNPPTDISSALTSLQAIADQMSQNGVTVNGSSNH